MGFTPLVFLAFAEATVRDSTTQRLSISIPLSKPSSMNEQGMICDKDSARIMTAIVQPDIHCWFSTSCSGTWLMPRELPGSALLLECYTVHNVEDDTMSELLPEREDLRRAVKWLSSRRKDDDGTTVLTLVNEAIFRFNLSPVDAEYLLLTFTALENSAIKD